MLTFWLVLCLLLIVIGIAGIILPFLPGIPLISLAYLIWGFASGWADFGVTTVIIMGVIGIMAILVDYYAGAVGAKKYGASPAGVWGALIGGVLGILILNIPGLILGPLLGAIVGELITGRSYRQAWQAGRGTFIAFIVVTVIKIAAGIFMAVLFLFLVIF